MAGQIPLKQPGDDAGAPDEPGRGPAARAAPAEQVLVGPSGGGIQVTVVDYLHEPWFSPARLRRGLSSASISFVVHLIVLAVLGWWAVPQIIHKGLPAIIAEALNEPEEELVTVKLDSQIEPAEELSFSVAASEALGVEGGGTPHVTEPVVASALVDRVPEGPRATLDQWLTVFPGSGENEMFKRMLEGAPGRHRAVVDGYDTALDRITQEILRMLEKSNVLVIWCFDESKSMKDDQSEIRERIDRVYTELGLSDTAAGEALLTAIVSYGRDFHVHTAKPTYDIGQIRAAIDQIPVDETGMEFMCQAVGRSIAQYKYFARKGKRQMALILVSDESGEPSNNFQYLEAMVQEARSTRCKVYVLGREAVFGYPYAHVHWVHPQTKHHHWLPVNRGPETAFVEQLQTDGFARRQDAYPSGFGSYGQSRMARQTGGIFFLLPSLESNVVRDEKTREYEMKAMRGYYPDLRARQEIVTDRGRSKLRMAIWKIVSDLNPYRPEVQKVTEMRVRFSPDYKTFVNQVAEEEQKAAVYLQYLDEAVKVLERMKPSREQEQSPRWQANYDLILAQLMAYKVRIYEYGAYLDTFVKNPKQVPLHKPPDLNLEYWKITTCEEMLTKEVTGEYLERANTLLAECAKNHVGTPWAARANWERKRGYGVTLEPVYWHTWRKGGGGRPVELIPIPKL